MSSCAATSRVIYFHFTLPQSFSQPQRAYRTHFSPGRIPPSPRLAISHLHHTCTYLHHSYTYLHHTCTLLNRYCAATFHLLTAQPQR
ncbi:hypothetical protein C356_06772 [Cryptococcus neoformans c45]|nr:hypothetical protein C356_06772 [Cryptococcus neoformans var. grubii c45]